MFTLTEISNKIDFDQIRWKNLIAIWASKHPGTSSELGKIQYLYLDDLRREKNINPEWVITFPEISFLHKNLFNKCQNVYDIRSFQDRISHPGFMNSICWELATRFHERWKITQNEDDNQTAFELAIEYWLRKEDVTNLVAIWPSNNLIDFLDNGSALRIYRSYTFHPKDSELSKSDSTKDTTRRKKFTLGNIPNSIPNIDEYYPLIYSVPILEDFLKKYSHSKIVDIGHILWRAGQKDELARTLWLLARDILDETDVGDQRINPELDLMNDMMLRAIGLYGLSEPLKVLSKDDETSTQSAYLFLIRVLEEQEKHAGDSPDRYYYRALKYWYGQYLWIELANSPNKDVTGPDFFKSIFNNSVLEILDNGKWFIDNSSKLDSQNGNEKVLVISRILQYCKYLQAPDYQKEIKEIYEYEDNLLLKPDDLLEYGYKLAKTDEQIHHPSGLFTFLFRDYKELFNRWCNLQDTFGSTRHQTSVKKLKDLLHDYDEWIGKIKAFPHEAFFLYEAARQDKAAIQWKLEQSATGAKLFINLRTPWIVQGIEEHLIFDIINIGENTATNIEFELNFQGQVDLNSEKLLTSRNLAPGQIIRKRWKLYAKPDTQFINISLKTSFIDEEKNIPIEFIEEIPSFEVKAKLPGELHPYLHKYQAGRAVAETDFYGRRTEIRQLLVRLITKNNTLIYGPQRMGKTSLLKELLCMLSDRRELDRFNLPKGMIEKLGIIHPIYISLHDLTLSEHLKTNFFQYYIYNEIYRVLEGENAHIPMRDENFKVDPVGTCKRELKKLFERYPNSRIVMLVDEWDRLYAPDFTGVATNLRSFIIDEERITWLFTSIYGIAQERVRSGSSLHNVLSPYKLKEMENEDAALLVEGPGLDANLTWQGEAVVTILEKTDRWPYLIQEVCIEVIDDILKSVGDNIFSEEGESHKLVTEDLVSNVLTKIVKNSDLRIKIFGNFWIGKSEDMIESISMRWMGCLILWALIDNKNNLKRAEIYEWIKNKLISYKKLPPAIKLLEEFDREVYKLQVVLGILDQNTANDYRIGVPLVRDAIEEFILAEDDLGSKANKGIWGDLEQGFDGSMQDGEFYDYFD